jgi:enoyl-CoA hydratase/carnithine racemase
MMRNELSGTESGAGTGMRIEVGSICGSQIMKITLDRPESGNRLTIEMVKQLTSAVARSSADPSIRAVVLDGAGGDFCRGREPTPYGGGRGPTALELRSQVTEPILELYATLREAAIPVLAGVSGAAFGLGCALAGACDITIASERASFALPELRSDLPPTLAISALSDRVPAKALAYLVYSGSEIDAETALRIGLISRVVPHADVEAEVESCVEALTSASMASVEATKRFLDHGRRMEPGAATLAAANLLTTVVSSR